MRNILAAGGARDRYAFHFISDTWGGDSAQPARGSDESCATALDRLLDHLEMREQNNPGADGDGSRRVEIYLYATSDLAAASEPKRLHAQYHAIPLQSGQGCGHFPNAHAPFPFFPPLSLSLSLRPHGPRIAQLYAAACATGGGNLLLSGGLPTGLYWSWPASASDAG